MCLSNCATVVTSLCPSCGKISNQDLLVRPSGFRQIETDTCPRTFLPCFARHLATSNLTLVPTTSGYISYSWRSRARRILGVKLGGSGSVFLEVGLVKAILFRMRHF